MSPIGEEEARQELRLVNSPAANPDRYGATRLDGGWVFSFRRESGPVLMGTGAWIVADNGRARRLSIQDHDQDVIDRELTRGPR